jgi:hypothetical protein
VGSTMVGGTLADIWETKERGVKMGMFALCAVLGNSESRYHCRRSSLTCARSRTGRHVLGRGKAGPAMALDTVDTDHHLWRCVAPFDHDARDSESTAHVEAPR